MFDFLRAIFGVRSNRAYYSIDRGKAGRYRVMISDTKNMDKIKFMTSGQGHETRAEAYQSMLWLSDCHFERGYRRDGE